MRNCWNFLKPGFYEGINVAHWAETWEHLADAVKDWLSKSAVGVDLPIIEPTFLGMNCLDPSSYESYSYKFRKADVVVCNYLFSENKTRLEEARLAVNRLSELTRPGCLFVVIDRRENNRIFEDNVVDLFESVFGSQIVVTSHSGTIATDEQVSDMGKVLIEALRSPRIKFFTQVNREPTVFSFVVKRELSAQ